MTAHRVAQRVAEIEVREDSRIRRFEQALGRKGAAGDVGRQQLPMVKMRVHRTKLDLGRATDCRRGWVGEIGSEPPVEPSLLDIRELPDIVVEVGNLAGDEPGLFQHRLDLRSLVLQKVVAADKGALGRRLRQTRGDIDLEGGWRVGGGGVGIIFEVAGDLRWLLDDAPHRKMRQEEGVAVETVGLSRPVGIICQQHAVAQGCTLGAVGVNNAIRVQRRQIGRVIRLVCDGRQVGYPVEGQYRIAANQHNVPQFGERDRAVNRCPGSRVTRPGKIRRRACRRPRP